MHELTVCSADRAPFVEVAGEYTHVYVQTVEMSKQLLQLTSALGARQAQVGYG